MNTKAHNENYEIVDSMSLLAFARSHGRMQLGKFSQADEQTGEVNEWQSLIFTNDAGERTFVSISEKLTPITSKYVVENHAQLQVIKGNSGKYMLCKQGNDSWESIDLPL